MSIQPITCLWRPPKAEAGGHERSCKMLEAVLDLMDEGVAILDDESRILFWNKAAAAFTGHSPEDFNLAPVSGASLQRRRAASQSSDPARRRLRAQHAGSGRGGGLRLGGH